MGEKYAKCVVGIYERDLANISCPDENGWTEWLYGISEPNGSYRRDVGGLPIAHSYESEPSWFGLQLCKLEYGETFELGNQAREKGQLAWRALNEKLYAANGSTLPDHKIIIAKDE